MHFIKSFIQKTLGKFGYQLASMKGPDDQKLYYDLYDAEAVKDRRFYNIGAGSFNHPCWTNVDHASDWYAGHQEQAGFLQYNIFSGDPLPIKNGTAEIIYTSHTIEHITDDYNHPKT